MKKVYLAGGCFWGTQHFFSLIDGILETKSGYANGTKENPTYEEVCSNEFKFAETVEIKYDEKVISLERILQKFFLTIDPTSKNRQGGDIGLQYRTGIYYLDEQTKKIAKEELSKLQTKVEKPIQIELLELKNFYPAEEYHQEYLYKNPHGYCHIPLDILRKANE
jgi:methionine-S-sulfoxide reductase